MSGIVPSTCSYSALRPELITAPSLAQPLGTRPDHGATVQVACSPGTREVAGRTEVNEVDLPWPFDWLVPLHFLLPLLTPFILFGLALVALNVYCLVDVVRRSDVEFEQAQQNRTLWLVLLIVGIFANFGAIVAILYLVMVRPKLPDSPASA